MTAYLARRALQAVAVVLLVTLIVFGLLGLSRRPGGGLAGDRGGGGQPDPRGAGVHSRSCCSTSAGSARCCTATWATPPTSTSRCRALLAASLPRTLVLTGTSTLLALAVAIPVGLLQAVRRGTAADHVLRGLTFVFYGTPSFVLGTVLILVFAVKLHELRR